MAPSVQCREVWLTPNTGVPCSNAAKMRNPLKFAGMPQTRQQISAVSGPNYLGYPKLVNRSQPLVGRSSPYCGDMWRTYCCLTNVFPIVDMCLSCEDIARQSCAMVPRWRFMATFLGPAFAASRVQHLLDLHSKFALGPHHVPKYGRYPTCGR